MTTTFRERCYDCFRPLELCFCESIPRINNETEIVILQHTRERFHPFNTARILRKALAKSNLVIGYTPDLAAMDLPFETGCGLLYPNEDARSLGDLLPEQRPRQLVVIDGTWHHAKTVFRDVATVQKLPRYKISPSVPGQYRIRREPDLQSLSTLEATVAALRELEPNLDVERLLSAFDAMVLGQLNQPNLKQAWRRKEKYRRPSLSIPRAFANNLDNVVVGYGESAPGERGVRRKASPPVFWVARRLGTNETFRAAIRPTTDFHSVQLREDYLAHLRLGREDFENAISIEAFRTQWQEFLRPSDRLAVFHKSTLRLLMHIDADFVSSTVLKAIKLPEMPRYRTLDELIDGEGLEVASSAYPDRASRRLENAIAYVMHLHRLTLDAMM